MDKISGGKDIKGILVSPSQGFGGAVAEHSISIPNKLFPCTRGVPRFSWVISRSSILSYGPPQSPNSNFIFSEKSYPELEPASSSSSTFVSPHGSVPKTSTAADTGASDNSSGQQPRGSTAELGVQSAARGNLATGSAATTEVTPSSCELDRLGESQRAAPDPRAHPSSSGCTLERPGQSYERKPAPASSAASIALGQTRSQAQEAQEEVLGAAGQPVDMSIIESLIR